jgi:hypothetical protein
MGACPSNKNDKDFRFLVETVGEVPAYNIWGINLENGEEGPILADDKAKEVVKKLVESGYVNTKKEAVALYAHAYDDSFREQNNISNPREVTYEMLIKKLKQSDNVYQQLTTGEIADVISSFYYAAIHNIDEFTALTQANLGNIDVLISDVENDYHIFAMIYNLKEGHQTLDELTNLANEYNLKEDFLSAVEQLEGYSSEEIYSFYEEKKRRIDIVKENKEYFIRKTINALKNDNINITNTLEDNDYLSDTDFEENMMENEGILAKASYETAARETASNHVKAFFKTIPEVLSYKNGVPVFNTNTFLGTPKMYMDTFNFVLSKSNNVVQVKGEDGKLVDPINEIVARIAKEGQYSPTYAYLADKLAKMPKNFHAQFLSAVSKYKSNLKDTLFKVSKGVVEARVVNADYLGDKVTIQRRWQEGFNSKFSELNNKDVLS